MADPKLELLKGDEDLLVATNECIQRYEKIKASLCGEGWEAVLSDLKIEKDRWVDGLSDPTNSVFKAGVIHGLRLVQDYTGAIDKKLNHLYQQKTELILLAQKNKENQ